MSDNANESQRANIVFAIACNNQLRNVEQLYGLTNYVSV